MKILIFLLLTSQTFAQGINVTPKNISPFGNIPTGNTVAGKCNGLSKDYLKLTIQPSCYGANLRGGGSVLDPNKGDVVMNLSIVNGSETFTSTIQFPNKITWPENYGQTCTWDNNTSGGKVICDMPSLVKVNYTCKYVYGGSKYGVQWFLDDYLDCNRVSDTNSDGTLNQNVKCSFLYSWAGTGYAAVQSYTKIANVANCGLQDKNVNLADSTTVKTSTPAGSISKYAKRGVVTIDMNNISIQKLSVTKNSSTGNFETSGNHSQVSAQFYQVKDGANVALTQKVESTFDEYEECLNIKASFLGQNQFCGSFYSPLMLFFDTKRPLFVGKSSFPLVDGYKFVTWPEKESAGYFLTLDKSDSKKITNKNQLFGDGSGFDNGFEALKALDSNKDGVINEKDENFKHLYLWQDKNGNGVSEPGEVKTLAEMKVKEISLKYKDDRRKSFNRNAEGRQYSTFTFGDNKTGDIIDIWLSPIANEEIKLNK